MTTFKFFKGFCGNVVPISNEQYDMHILRNYYNRTVNPDYYEPITIRGGIDLAHNSEVIISIARSGSFSANFDTL